MSLQEPPFLIKLYNNLYKIVFFPIIVMAKLSRGEYSLTVALGWFLICSPLQIMFFLLIWGWPLLLLDKRSAALMIPVYYVFATTGVWRSADNSKTSTLGKYAAKIVAVLYMIAAVIKSNSFR